MANELQNLKYEGSIVFAGFGEPLLYPNLLEIIPYFKDIRIEIVTNGDLLTVKFIKDLYASGVDLICVSMYDGVEQIEKFNTMFSDAGIDKDGYLLRDRWHTNEDDYGLKLTNRAGVVNIGKQDPIDVSKPCYYPHYSMTIDWNADVLLCVQDWNKKVKLGNIYAQTLLEAWNSNLINKYRKTLGNCNRNLNPCQNCNADGTLHGFNHIKYWESEK